MSSKNHHSKPSSKHLKRRRRVSSSSSDESPEDTNRVLKEKVKKLKKEIERQNEEIFELKNTVREKDDEIDDMRAEIASSSRKQKQKPVMTFKTEDTGTETSYAKQLERKLAISLENEKELKEELEFLNDQLTIDVNTGSTQLEQVENDGQENPDEDMSKVVKDQGASKYCNKVWISYRRVRLNYARFMGIIVSRRSSYRPTDRYPANTYDLVYSTYLGLIKYTNYEERRNMEMGETYEFSVADRRIEKRNIIVIFHLNEIRRSGSQSFILNTLLNKIDVPDYLYDRIQKIYEIAETKDDKKYKHEIPCPSCVRIKAVVMLQNAYVKRFMDDENKSIFRVDRIIEVINCNNGFLLPVQFTRFFAPDDERNL